MIYTDTQKFTYKNDLLNSFNHMFSGAHKLAARGTGTKMCVGLSDLVRENLGALKPNPYCW